MVDPLKYSYYLVLVTEKKKKYDITNFVEDLGGKSWKTNSQQDYHVQ